MTGPPTTAACETVIYTGAGPGMVTDEIAPLGGFTTATDTAGNPSSERSEANRRHLAKEYRDIGWDTAAIDFEGVFEMGRLRSPAGQSEKAGHFDAGSLPARCTTPSQANGVTIVG